MPRDVADAVLRHDIVICYGHYARAHNTPCLFVLLLVWFDKVLIVYAMFVYGDTIVVYATIFTRAAILMFGAFDAV